MKTIYEIEKMPDGTFTSRIVSANGRLTFSNHQADTKQAAYKNLATNIKLIARSIAVDILSVNKVRNKNKLNVITLSRPSNILVTVTVKEINC